MSEPAPPACPRERARTASDGDPDGSWGSTGPGGAPAGLTRRHTRSLRGDRRRERYDPAPRHTTAQEEGPLNFWNRLEAVAEQHSVLRPSFYVRWSEGALGSAA